MVIVGYRTITKALGMLLAQSNCIDCQTPVYKQIVRERFWITVFWIPILPVWTNYYLACPACGMRIKIKRAEAKQMLNNCERFTK